MQTKSSNGLINTLLKQLKRLAFTLNERPSTAVEEYTLEHFLLYHGLVGSSPENQKEFREVRADLQEAFQQKSSISLAIALKLKPLWWEEKLQSIFAELANIDKKQTIELLLPSISPGQDLSPANCPLHSEDWRVRANTANMLNFLQAQEAVPRIIESLKETQEENLKAAFCHISYALSGLRTEQARKALTEYLLDDEPWFRVDAARALAAWPLNAVAGDLSAAMLNQHNLSDYMAVSIARKHSPASFLKRTDKLAQEAALEMIIETVNAGSQTHKPEIVLETGVLHCWDNIFQSAKQDPTPRHIRAALSIADWLIENASSLPENLSITESTPDDSATVTKVTLNPHLLRLQADELLEIISGQSIRQILLAHLSQFQPTKQDKLDDIRHTIWLLGRLRVKNAVPKLIALLKEHLPVTDDLISTLGLIGDPETANELVSLAKQTVDLDERIAMPHSTHPVEESNPTAARHYWHILNALGKLPNGQATEFLIQAASDFAPDKRQQAIQSLVSAHALSPDKNVSAKLPDVIRAGLADSSAPVKLAALDGVLQFQLIDLIPKVLKLLDSKEISISRKSLTVMSELADLGHKDKVRAAVGSKLKVEFDSHKRERLQHFFDGLA